MPDRRSSLRPSGVRPSWLSTYSTTPISIKTVVEAANAAGVGRERGASETVESPEHLQERSQLTAIGALDCHQCSTLPDAE